MEDVSYHPGSTQIRSPIQTQQPGKQETGSGCHCKSNNDFETMSKMGVSVHQSTISCSLHKAGFFGHVVRKMLLLKKTHRKAGIASGKSILVILQACGEKFCGQTRQKLNFLVEMQSVRFDAS